MGATTVTGVLAGVKQAQDFAVIVRTAEGDVYVVIPPLALQLLPDPAAHFERLVGEKMGFCVVPGHEIDGARVLDTQYRNSEARI
ncbi:TPA: hypothetical protein I8303_002378 [Aeromonas hydrophila]|uniref:hypothetical protein n=1 Tax=Aeromonas hydrophila TaxID=644 RepID=UPI000C32E9DD|nr:hypothetical protein [Aeromonas hydrophila]PKD25732.1 hypothetical protein AO056_00807 [Aeromonas hydrophila]WRK93700.1 hypothetical protein U8518_08535 [Aeromonas hydrophila]HAT2713646.1 hypothetical protein [Aeromonas hydrophila]